MNTTAHLRPFSLLFLAICAAALFVLSACRSEPSTQPAQTVQEAAATPTATAQPAPPTDTPVPAQPTPTPTEAPTPVPPDETALSAALAAEVGADPNGDGIRGVDVQALEPAAGQPRLWVAYTLGFAYGEPDQIHLVALYEPTADGWNELGRVKLECATYVDERSVEQVFIDEASIWVAVQSGAGAHSGCFDLLRWDGQSFAIAVSGFNSSPNAGEVSDVDGDGRPEVVLNDTDPYIFCYACGVRLYAARILRWNGERLVEVPLERLPDGAPADVRAANDRAVELAEADLLTEALPLIEQAAALAPKDPRVHWNAVWIRHHLQNRKEYADLSPFKPLSYAFYGDWEAALDALWALGPEQFLDQPPIPEGSPAAGYEEVTGDLLVQFADAALAVRPDWAAVHFLRGWGHYLLDATDPAVETDLADAAQLAPDDPRFAEALALLRENSDRGITPPAAVVPIPTTVEPVYFEAGATVHLLETDLGENQARGYSLDIGGGQSLYVTAPAAVEVFLLDAAHRPLAGVQVSDAVRFDIPTTATYILVLRGSNAQEVILHIPPAAANPLRPASTQRVRFAAGGRSAVIETTLQRDAPQGFVLGIGARQRLQVTAVEGDVGFRVLDPAGLLLTAYRGRTVRSAIYLIPRSGDYTLVLDGEGPATVGIDIPPLDESGNVLPFPATPIRFAPGATSATVDVSPEPGLPDVFALEAMAKQRMILTVDADTIDVSVLDPQSQTLVADVEEPGHTEYYLPVSGQYTLLVTGVGRGKLTVEIP